MNNSGLVKYILLAKKSEIQDEEIKQLEKEINRKFMQTEVNTDLFDEKLKNFSEKYLDEDLRSREFTELVDKVDKDKIKNLFSDSKNRRWLKAFLDLDSFDVYKYLENTQDIKGAKEKLVIKEAPLEISYAYLNPEINKSGICDKDWDEYLENFVPYEIFEKIKKE